MSYLMNVPSCTDSDDSINGRHPDASEPSPLPDIVSVSGSSSSTGMKPPQPVRTSIPRKSYSSATAIPKELVPPGAIDSLESSPPPDGASSSSSTSSTSKVQARTSSRARMPYPAKERLAESAAKRRMAESTETWEEWKEKSRRLYGTGDNSRLRNSSSGSTLNGTPPSHSAPPTRDSSDIPRLAPESRLGPDPPPMVAPTHDRGPQLPPPATTGPLTGPGSAFLQGPGGPFPRPPPPTTTPPTHPTPAASTSSSAAPVPSGRTIYSTDDHVENED
ncbi:hypothetical protein P691DRAFT_804149 [Macrolepiota fuliginosa MF-IS2]|uniref:Uncharacterized protein n=1 Tax=Macrolepiota fuliginosa MF-IS2 TaxID=1400762 RepID=A0A9P5XSU8_9AGAR|nr:hypothetical protein P691DRAFT_804149 [Macrolepiota fuliginosa MF-IS2]